MSERQPMGVQDALWLEMDRPSNLMVVDALMWTAEPVDWDRFTDTVKERLWDRYRVFRSRAVHDDNAWHWEECGTDSFDTHLEFVQLPEPGGDAELQQFVAAQRTAPLDRDRPLWMMFCIDGFNGGSAVLTRTHHAIADGIRMVQLAMSLFDATRGGRADPGPVGAERFDAADGARSVVPRADPRWGRGGRERAGRSDEHGWQHGRQHGGDGGHTLTDPVGTARAGLDAVGDTVGDVTSAAGRSIERTTASLREPGRRRPRHRAGGRCGHRDDRGATAACAPTASAG